MNGHVRQLQFALPITDAQRLSGVLNEDGGAPIDRLLEPRRPSAVVWLVIAVHFLAIKGVILARSLAHVGQEVFKSAFSGPARAHGDAATAVVFPLFEVWVRAAVDHHPVGPIFRTDIAASRVTVLRRFISLVCSQFVCAAARLCIAASQIANAGDLFLSAIADAFEGAVSALMPAFLKNGEHVEFLSDDVDFFRHVRLEYKPISP